MIKNGAYETASDQSTKSKSKNIFCSVQKELEKTNIGNAINKTTARHTSCHQARKPCTRKGIDPGAPKNEFFYMIC
ncbi:hypothetical protein Plhal304r1_c039g0116721 [Plasmopara halstedii]